MSHTIVGDDLIEDFPLIHAVGRAAAQAPRLIDMSWGDPAGRKVTLVGKGVCFDSGGLDIKSDSAMLLMKKDMGGAASVLALAHMIMDRKLDLRLRVLIPAVENAISGPRSGRSTWSARAKDFMSRSAIPTPKAGSSSPMRWRSPTRRARASHRLGTLTGAARVALGPDLPPYYTDDETLASEMARQAAPRTIRCGACHCGAPTTR